MASNFQLLVFRAILLVLFVISLAFVLFLANGYNYDFVSNQIRRTGIIDVTFADKDAKVYLDGKMLDGNLPFVASNVLPGRYILIVAREGFWDWSREIMVNENIISKVDDVLLYPLDEHAISKVLWKTADVKTETWLKEGYFFRQEGRNLFFAQLNADLNEGLFRKIELPIGELVDIDVQFNKAVLNFDGGKRYLLDLISADWRALNSNKNLVYSYDKWLYFKGSLLAVFELNLKKVAWAKEFPDQKIESVRSISWNQQNYLLIKMAGQNGANLYQYVKQNLLKITDQIEGQPLFDEKGDLIVLKTNGELLKMDLVLEKSYLLARFSENVGLIGYAINPKRTAGQLIWKQNNQIMIGNLDFTNVRNMFNNIAIIDLKLIGSDKVYYLEKIQADQSEQIRLMEMVLAI